jgi:hypothetical protein
MKRALLLAAAALILAGCTTTTPLASTITVKKPTDLVFVYIHGFGGAKKSPQFCENLNSFLKKTPYNCEVRNHEWDSVKINVTTLGAGWLKAERLADKEAAKFKKTVIDPLEASRTPYVIVGYSIGTRVVLRALEQTDGKMKMLKGVYFLGSAMNRDITIKPKHLPSGLKIVNYHSPKRDQVHQLAFHFMEEIPAGGRLGFDDTSVFENYTVACSHTHKPIAPHIDYSQMAQPIAYIALMDQRMHLPGKTSFNLKNKVNGSAVWWNKIIRIPCKLKGKSCVLELEQQNMNKDYFRAVAEYPDGTRVRVARGNNIHAIIDSLNILPRNYWRKP